MKTNPLIQNNPNNNDIISRFQKFRQSFSGNPQQQVQQLLNSGRISQEQYNAAVQKAQQLGQLMGMKL
jgi:hypothetical protein